MRGLLCLFITSLLLLPIANAGAPVPVAQSGAIFGGASLAANASGAVELSFEQLPAIAEDFTATWCGNCVPVEHALQDAADEVGAVILHIHRNPDSEDPFGIIEANEWWTRRYESPMPPTVISNGMTKQEGSVAHGESLEVDFKTSLRDKPDIGSGDSQFIWALGENGTGVFSWSLQANPAYQTFVDAEAVNNWLFVVEDVIAFEEGSNEAGEYPHVVRMLVDLGTEWEGQVNVTLPLAWDGDDLHLVLIHEIINPPDQGCCNISDHDNAIPAPGIVFAIAIIFTSAIYRKQHFKR